MFKFFKKKEEEEKNSLVRGLVYGLGGAFVVLIVVLLILFGGSIKDKILGNDQQNQPGSDSGDSQSPKLRFTIITSKECGDKCFDINLLIDAIKQNNINQTGMETLYIEDRDGKRLADQYAITKVPALLVGGEINKDENLANAWPVLGEIVDNVFVYREVIPPYIDIASGQLKGLVDSIYLTDNSCEECYDVSLHDIALSNLGITFQDKKTIDISSDEGKDLLNKYKITKVPTVLLRGELSEYAGVQQIWPMVGEVAEDGTYVFTKLDEMGSYKDLETGELVEVQLPDLTGATQQVITQ